MERRTLLTGAVGLMLANKVLAEPGAGNSAKAGKGDNVMTEVTVAGLYRLVELELSDSMTVVLKARDQERYVTMWIGRPEGASIYAHLHGEKVGRPSSQDFMAELVKSLGGEVESVNITL